MKLGWTCIETPVATWTVYVQTWNCGGVPHDPVIMGSSSISREAARLDGAAKLEESIAKGCPDCARLKGLKAFC